MPRVLSVGSVNLDIQVRCDEPLEPGATRRGRDFHATGGGKAANRAFMARMLGVPAQLFATVGTGEFTDRALARLRELGVDLSALRIAYGQVIGVSTIVVAADGDKTIVLAANANSIWTAEQRSQLKAAIARADRDSIVAIDLEVPQEVCVVAASAARAAGLRVVIDPSPSDQLSPELCALASYVTPNAEEARALTGVDITGPEAGVRAGEVLLQRGVEGACVKLPGGGCALVTREDRHIVQAPQVSVADKTGAGDAFAGAFSVALSEGQSPLEAARWGTAAACLKLGAYGSQSDFIDRARLLRMVEQVELKACTSW
jgi:ribokinase